MNGIKKLERNFQSPTSSYRSLPFWAWNENLCEEEILSQIKDMHCHGIGGFFIHSREGLETEYLSEKWLEMVKVAVSKAKELGMEVWIYDEDRWPSGTAGGTVVREGGDACRCKGLTVQVCDKFIFHSDIKCLYIARVEGMETIECRRISLNNAEPLKEGEAYLIFRLEISEPSEWFNDGAPPDNLNPKTVRRFLESTHEVYRKSIENEFGKTVKGIFTDEPSLHDRHTVFNPRRGWIPWTYEFERFFKERRGYDIYDYIPYIYFNDKYSFSIRHDYWRTVTELYSESYSKQIGSWCEKQGIAFTGHYLQEDKLGIATRVEGAIMPHYIYQQMPGIDILREQTDEYLTVKQCSSVANQFAKPDVISETYGATGWDFTFEGQKWAGDWQYALGVTRRCQHQALYSLRGLRKRDYPPSFNYQNCWWKYINKIEDYFARVSALLSYCQAIRDVLIIHPSTTAWGMLGTNPYGNPVRRLERDVPAINKIGDDFNKLLRQLSGMHYDYDLGDEMVMSENAKVIGGDLSVKYASYKTVVLPPNQTMLDSTFSLLIEFMNSGGKVIAVKPFATMIDGRNNIPLDLLFRHKNLISVDSYNDIGAALEMALERRISIEDENGEQIKDILYILKDTEIGKALFVINNNRKEGYMARIIYNGICVAEEWDCLSGERTLCDFTEFDEKTEIKTYLAPVDSKMYVMRENSELQPKEHLFFDLDKKNEYITLGQEVSFKRIMPNALTLDRCCWRFEKEMWSESLEVWKAQYNLRERLNMRQIHYEGVLQRYKWINDNHPKNGTKIQLKFKFEIYAIPKNISLVIERAKDFQITINGKTIPNEPSGYYFDRSFDMVKLDYIKLGENEIVLETEYMHDMELENCYLVGDFAVDDKRRIVKEPDKLRLGDWCLQGYPHYAGSIDYIFEFKCETGNGGKFILKLDDYDASAVEVRVNGKSAETILWKSQNAVDITDCVTEGINRADIKLMGSMRNLLGPFHYAGGNPTTCNNQSFRTEGEKHTEGYNLHPYGIFNPIKIYKL